MTQEEKDLLLKDLSARLPYQPICEFTDAEDDFCTATAALGYSLRDFIAGKTLIKPYLRPLSSMTEEERAEYFLLKHRDNDRDDNIIFPDEASALIDWLNKKMFDYRGLIEKSLALPATEGMYNTK